MVFLANWSVLLLFLPDERAGTAVRWHMGIVNLSVHSICCDYVCTTFSRM